MHRSHCTAPLLSGVLQNDAEADERLSHRRCRQCHCVAYRSYAPLRSSLCASSPRSREHARLASELKQSSLHSLALTLLHTTSYGTPMQSLRDIGMPQALAVQRGTAQSGRLFEGRHFSKLVRSTQTFWWFKVIKLLC